MRIRFVIGNISGVVLFLAILFSGMNGTFCMDNTVQDGKGEAYATMESPMDSGPEGAHQGQGVFSLIRSHMNVIVQILVLTILAILFQWNRIQKKERTKLKQTEEALRRSEELFKRTFFQAPQGAAIIDGQGNFVKVNQKLTEIMGYSEEEFMGRSIFDMTHPDDADKIRDKNRAMRSGAIEYCYFNTRSIRKDNSIVWTYISVRPIFDAHGRPAYFLPMIEDITEKKMTEDALMKLSRAVEQSPASVIMTDPSGNIEYVNPKFTEITGYSQEESLGKNPSMLSSGNQDKAFYKELWDTILNGDMWQGEFANKKKNGELYWELASISPVRNQDGDITHFVAVKEDITERKKTDEALQKQLEELNQTKQNMLIMMKDLEKAKVKAEEATRAKGEFLANMSHEIRTPMNAIMGMSHLALKTDLSEQQRDYLSKIQESSQALLTIINDILDISKIEAGKLLIEDTDFDLEEIMKKVVSMINIKAGQKHLELLLDIKPMLPTRLIGDPLRLTQVVTNLADNAIKFTSEGEIVIGVEIKELKGKDIVLLFQVKDSGIGMTEEQKNTLFTPFTQADTSTTRTYGGTGLGLSICKHLVEMMGGTIGITSAPNQGSTFYFTARFGLQQNQGIQFFALNENVKGKQALVVDDNGLARNIMEEHLRPFGLDVELAESGPEALNKLETCKPDLIFMDYKMPGMDGLECARRIREKNGSYRPKIIMVTAYGDDGVKNRAREADIDGFLLKPLSPSLLFDAVITVMSQDGKPGDFIQPERVADPEITRSMKGKRVLLVEDNAINIQLAVELLQSAGLDVRVAVNGEEAVDRVGRESFDAVLMDVQMPVMDGLEATRKIRDLGYSTRDLPIIAMTAHAMAGDREKSLASGMNDHITKPVDPDQLYAVLAKWMECDREYTEHKKTRDPFSSAEYKGISIEKGLKHTGGNHDLYRHLIKIFVADYSGASSQIEDALSRRDNDAVRILAHTIKGIAGNIGAVGLYEASSALEKDIGRNVNDFSGDNVKRFHQNLAEVLDSLDKMIADTEIPVEATDRQTDQDQQALLMHLKNLGQVIRSRNPKKCMDVIKHIEPFAGQEPHARALTSLCDSVRQYHYTDAEPVLASLIDHMEGGTNHD